jgi:hypothetical protein
MIVALLLCAAYAAGVDLRRLALLAGAVHFPMAVGALIALHWFRARSGEDHGSVMFCEVTASELRSGASLRDALEAALASAGDGKFHRSGASVGEMAVQAGEQFPEIGVELELTVLAAARAGGDSASLFDDIGSLALAQSEVRREVRIATAPGRATALVLVAAPVAYLMFQVDSGGLAGLLAASEQRLVAVLGMGLFATGLIVALFVLWRAGR